MNVKAQALRLLTLVSLLAVGAALLAVTPAHAQSPTFQPHGYVGGNIGQPDWRSNEAAGVTAGDTGGTGLKVYGGYAFTPNVALEAGGVRLGRLAGTGGTAKADGVFLDAVGTVPLNAQWAVLGRLGLVNAKVRGPAGSERDTGAKGGVGLQYRLSDNLAVRGEWERYGLKAFGSSPKVDMVSVGVNFAF